MIPVRKILTFITLVGVSGAVLALTGCEKPQQANPQAEASSSALAMPSNMTVTKRWYTKNQVKRGYSIFQANCSTCHKPDASGTKDWQTPLENGKYPPPPINCEAHAWHHPLNILRRVVNKGGVALGGWMPGFEDKLSDQDVDDVLAWVQSNWPEEKYHFWSERNKQSQ